MKGLPMKGAVLLCAACLHCAATGAAAPLSKQVGATHEG
jgi:hypothetical protein